MTFADFRKMRDKTDDYQKLTGALETARHQVNYLKGIKNGTYGVTYNKTTQSCELTTVEGAVLVDCHIKLLETRLQELNLGFNKRISILAHNWAFDRPFIEDWLGHENFNYHIDGRYRDTMVVASYLNDYADHRFASVPFNRLNLRALATIMKIEWEYERGHDAIYDCIKTAEVYRELVKRTL